MGEILGLLVSLFGHVSRIARTLKPENFPTSTQLVLEAKLEIRRRLEVIGNELWRRLKSEVSLPGPWLSSRLGGRFWFDRRSCFHLLILNILLRSLGSHDCRLTCSGRGSLRRNGDYILHDLI
jgi:hypothetical protein